MMSGEKVVEEEHKRRVNHLKQFLRGTTYAIGRKVDFNKTFDFSQPKDDARMKFKDLKAHDT